MSLCSAIWPFVTKVIRHVSLSRKRTCASALSRKPTSDRVFTVSVLTHPPTRTQKHQHAAMFLRCHHIEHASSNRIHQTSAFTWKYRYYRFCGMDMCQYCDLMRSLLKVSRSLNWLKAFEERWFSIEPRSEDDDNGWYRTPHAFQI